MIYIDPKATIERRLATGMGFDKYEIIMNVFKVTDVSTSEQFPKTFNAFYRVRRNEQWRKAYYSLFKQKRKKNVLLRISYQSFITLQDK